MTFYYSTNSSGDVGKMEKDSASSKKEGSGTRGRMIVKVRGSR